MANIIIAPDSFKGSLTSNEFINVARKTLKKLDHQNIIHAIPLADGGEGTLDAIALVKNGKYYTDYTTNQYGKEIKVKYFVTDDNEAIIETASIIGLPLAKYKNTMVASSYGIGTLINDIAYTKGVKKFILAIGGSSTTDAGAGMLAALGVKFYGSNDIEFIPTGATLNSIERIDASELKPLLDLVSFKILADVTNPLYGENGASFIYAPQKGANEKEVIILDNNLKHFAHLSNKLFDTFKDETPGAGAAGGIGYGCLTYLNAIIISGINYILDSANYSTLIKDCDYIITGEGKIDSQSLMGKVLSGIMAKSNNKKIISIVGKNDLKERIDNLDVYALCDYTSIDNAIKHPKKYLKQVIIQNYPKF